MCEILEVMKVKGHTLVECTYSDGDFMRAKSIAIFDNSGKPCKIRKFRMDRSRQCFSGKPVSPWFGIEEKVDDVFLKRGNKVVFEY